MTAAGTVARRARHQPGRERAGRGSARGGQRAAYDLLLDVEMDVTAELGRTRMTVRSLLDLEPGSIVELDRMAGSPVDLLVNGRLIARGEVVVVDEEFALRRHRDRRLRRGGRTLMGTMGVAIRMVVSLAVVLLPALRGGPVRAAGETARRRWPELTVVSRCIVGSKASVAVVQLGDRALVVGVTEQSVTLLVGDLRSPSWSPQREPRVSPKPRSTPYGE